MLNNDTAIAVHIVQEAMANIDEAIAQSAGSIASVDVDFLQSEARETVMGLIASLITADGFLHPQEREFLVRLVEVGDRPNAELAFLREYAERWRRQEQTVPGFFRQAVEADLKNQSDSAGSLTREIQLIANNCSIADGESTATEKRIISNYLRLLDDYIEQETANKSSWLEP
jgi:hypothetical protein